MTTHGRFEPVFCTIVPPHVLDQLAAADDPASSGPARRTLEHDARERTRRRLTAASARRAGPRRRAAPSSRSAPIYDARHQDATCPAAGARRGRDPARTPRVNRAYDGLGATFELYLKATAGTRSTAQGLPLNASVHYGEDYNNAFWNGEQMVFGDGDGEIFLDFTLPVDVIGHELTHGVTQYTANLDYFGQSGALNESVSDVFGSLIKQYSLGQTADEADWLIGAGLLAPRRSASPRWRPSARARAA